MYVQTHKGGRNILLLSFSFFSSRREKEKNNANVPCQHINEAANPLHIKTLQLFLIQLLCAFRIAVSGLCVAMIIAHLDYIEASHSTE